VRFGLARFGTVDATAAEGIELSVITSTVVGGVAITGGVGTVVGAVLGALLLSVFSSTLVFLAGAFILAAGFPRWNASSSYPRADAYLAHRHALRFKSEVESRMSQSQASNTTPCSPH